MASIGNLKLILSARMEGGASHDIGTIELPVTTETIHKVGDAAVEAHTQIDRGELERRLTEFAAALSGGEIAGPLLPRKPLPWQEALAFAENGSRVAIFAEDLTLAQGFLGEFEDILDDREVKRISRSNGAHAIDFKSGGEIRFYSTRSIPRGKSLDRLYVPAISSEDVMLNLHPLVATSGDPAIVCY